MDKMYTLPRPYVYTVIRSNRKIVAIQVNADLSVTVKVPYRATKKDVERILKEKEPWIRKHREEITKKKAEYEENRFLS